jgi:hypothetical protein
MSTLTTEIARSSPAGPHARRRDDMTKYVLPVVLAAAFAAMPVFPLALRNRIKRG